MTDIRESRLDMALELASFNKEERNTIYQFLKNSRSAVCSILNGHGLILIESFASGLTRIDVPDN